MANQLQVGVTYRDALTGSSLGRIVFADLYQATREVITGNSVGMTWFAAIGSTHREAITGSGVGMTWFTGIGSTYREVLYREAPVRVMGAYRESIASLPNDPLTVAVITANYRELTSMRRPTMPVPSTVWSSFTVGTLKQQVVRKVTRIPPYSLEQTMTLRAQVLVRRITPPPMPSPITMPVYRQQVVQSRSRVYVPVSACYAAMERQLVTTHRATGAPSTIRSTLTGYILREQVVMSRRVTAVVITTDAFVGTLAQQSVHHADRIAPRSEIDAATLVSMTLQRNHVAPPGSDIRASTLSESAVIKRIVSAEMPHGEGQVATEVQQVVIERQPDANHSTTRVNSDTMLTVMHRDTYAPAFASGRHVYTNAMQAVIERTMPPLLPRGYIYTGVLRVTYVLHLTTPAPIDVIDPAVGRHVAQWRMLSVGRRITQSPDEFRALQRIVYNLGATVVLGDHGFPLPEYPPPAQPIPYVFMEAAAVVLGDADDWELVTSVVSDSVIEHSAIGDNVGWIDPRVPMSDLTVDALHAMTVLGDGFPDPANPASDAEVASMTAASVLGDSGMPDPMLPLSEIEVRSVLSVGLLGDLALPNPSIPLSDATVTVLVAATAIRDADMVGKFTMSQAGVLLLVEACVQVDIELVGFKLRTGPRPVISVSIS